VQSHAERIWPDSGSAAPHDISQLFQKLWIVCVSPVTAVRGGCCRLAVTQLLCKSPRLLPTAVTLGDSIRSPPRLISSLRLTCSPAGTHFPWNCSGIGLSAYQLALHTL
jgi:hypothetical protein